MINKYIGDTYITNEGYEIEIIDYINRHNVLVKFNQNPNYQVWTTMQNIKKGQIKNPYHLSVYGKGFYGVGNYKSRINNIKTEQYIKWCSMFVRCYDEDYHKKSPSYRQCEVSDEFYNFQNFAQWYDKHYYECDYTLELDKDLIVEGNKTYSPSTCCLLPDEINIVLKTHRHNKKRMRE